MLRFSHMIFYVADVSATVAFYEEAFGLKIKFVHESGDYAELDTGTTALGFASEEMAAMNLPGGYQGYTSKQPPFASEIALKSDDVSRDYKHAVESGAEPLVEPLEKPWGQRVGYLRDPNGILIEIGSEMQA